VSRPVYLFVALVAAAAFFACAASAQEPKVTTLGTGIKLGETFEGEIGKDQKLAGYWWLKGDKNPTNDPNLYQAAIPVTLKAGQGITIAATAAGQDRFVGIRLVDPAGKRIKEDPDLDTTVSGHETAMTWVAPKAAEITVKEVAASGKYTIVVVSNRVGGVTVKTSSPGEGESREALEKQLKDLKKKVEEVEAKLKALDSKPTPPPKKD